MIFSDYGLQDNLDISIYANPDFSCFQMDQIRWGLADNLDVSLYANPEYTWNQMEQIRLELKANLENEITNEKNIQ